MQLQLEKIIVSRSKLLILVQTESDYFFIACKDDPSTALAQKKGEIDLSKLGTILYSDRGYPPNFVIEYFKKEYGFGND